MTAHDRGSRMRGNARPRGVAGDKHLPAAGATLTSHVRDRPPRLPCFDVAATLRFYTEVLGGTLRHAQTGPAEAWQAKEYLLMAFELPGGLAIDFFSFDGIRRPEEALSKDICHVALAVGSGDAVMRCRDRFASASVPCWLERTVPTTSTRTRRTRTG